MSFVGGKYEFDLFISYSHGTASTDATRMKNAKTLRDWSRSLAEKLADNLSIRLNAEQSEDESQTFSYFLDQREFDSGEPISATIKAAAARSSLLLILASPYYLRSKYCLEEVEAFFEQAHKDGRGREHCVIREILPTREDEWPQQLRDAEGKVVNRGESFFDPETELPIDIDGFREEGKTPNLSAPRSRLTITISKKLQDLREQIRAREDKERLDREREHLERLAREATLVPMAPSANGAAANLDRKPIYLQAEFDNIESWGRIKGELSRLFQVNPKDLRGFGDAVAVGELPPSLLATYEERRRKMLRYCNGLVLLRAKPDDDMELQLLAAQSDLATLRQDFRMNLPWALVDEVGDAPSDLGDFTIARVPTNVPNWPEQVGGALGFAAAAEQ